MAISILQMLRGVYHDDLKKDQHGRWTLEYAQQGVNKSGWDNISLERCIDRAPVAVITQQSLKNSPEGSTYKILGLGKVKGFDKNSGIFHVVEWTGDTKTARPIPIERDVALQLASINRSLERNFEPFEASRPTTLVKRRARDEAFRRTVIALYDGKCSICGNRWVVGKSYEVQAAHIISKLSHGSDDPRNGLAMCRFHHWAFDRGVFSIADDYTIVVTTRLNEFSNKPEQIKLIEGTKLLKPLRNAAVPDRRALSWHREKTFLN